MSLVNIGLFYLIEQNSTAVIISIITFVIYSTYVFLGGRIMQYSGENYADVFLSEYLEKRG